MIRTTLVILAFTLFVVHDLDEVRHAKIAAIERAEMRRQLEGLRTDVADLKQTADALGVACMSRGQR